MLFAEGKSASLGSGGGRSRPSAKLRSYYANSAGFTFHRAAAVSVKERPNKDDSSSKNDSSSNDDEPIDDSDYGIRGGVAPDAGPQKVSSPKKVPDDGLRQDVRGPDEIHDVPTGRQRASRSFYQRDVPNIPIQQQQGSGNPGGGGPNQPPQNSASGRPCPNCRSPLR